MFNHKFALLSLVLLLSLAGCRKGCNESDLCDPCSEVEVPLADVQFHSMFDEDIDEFDMPTEVEACGADTCDLRDFAWVEDTENPDGFKTVYFGYDGRGVREDQREALEHNIELIRARLAEDPEYEPTIVCEGHACHAAGRSTYNMAISEARARTIADCLIEAGIPEDCVKCVGRGEEVPAIIDGVEVTGDRLAQAPNRRCEMRVIYA